MAETELNRSPLSSLSSSSASSSSAMDVNQTLWDKLPLVVLEQVLKLLDQKDRYSVSQVCRHWSLAFQASRAWTHLSIHPRSFTSKVFTVQHGCRRELNQTSIRNCLLEVGQHVQNLTITTMDDHLHLHSVVENLLKIAQEKPDVMPMLRSMHFTYNCETRNRSGSFLHGIPETILIKLLEFISLHQANLLHVTLNDLMLSREHVETFLSRLVFSLGVQTLTKLELRNCTAEASSLNQISDFTNLQTFITSPQQLSDVLVLKLAENGLKTLHIVQDIFTSYAAPLAREVWIKVRAINESLHVKLICTGFYKHDVLIQQGAPVSHVLYDTPHSVISPVTISSLTEYSETLTVYGHKSLPKLHGRSTHDRADSLLLLLIENCPNLQVLVIRDRISTASLLLIAKKTQKLRKLFVRRNCVLKRLDWSQAEWSDEFYTWLKRGSKTIEIMEREVSEILGYSWHAMTDGEFSQLSNVDI